jgi:hypothetical protein
MRALVGAFDQLAIKHRDDDETQIFFGLYLLSARSPFAETFGRANRAIVLWRRPHSTNIK